MWTKERVLAAYRRAASENGGMPLGVDGFDKIVPTRAWRGKYFARFSDLVREAGFEPRGKNVRYTDAALLEPVAELVRRLGRLATEDERIMERRGDVNFPSNTTLRKHFRGPDGITAALRSFCVDRADYDDVLAILDRKAHGAATSVSAPKIVGFVYMMKHRGYYKIGRTNDVGRRRSDLKLLVPEPHLIVHEFETDDPRGIEAYWHNRFADKRCEGTREYFDLSPQDVAAFQAPEEVYVSADQAASCPTGYSNRRKVSKTSFGLWTTKPSA